MKLWDHTVLKSSLTLNHQIADLISGNQVMAHTALKRGGAGVKTWPWTALRHK